jgi:hypothetical protein
MIILLNLDKSTKIDVLIKNSCVRDYIMNKKIIALCTNFYNHYLKISFSINSISVSNYNYL